MSDYSKIKRFVKRSGKTTKQAICKEFKHLSWREVKVIHKQLQEKGIIADNGDEWLCELLNNELITERRKL